jgi:hypothetical protein
VQEGEPARGGSAGKPDDARIARAGNALAEALDRPRAGGRLGPGRAGPGRFAGGGRGGERSGRRAGEGVGGGPESAFPPQPGAGRARVSSLPFAVSGRLSRNTKAAGTMYSGSRASAAARSCSAVVPTATT